MTAQLPVACCLEPSELVERERQIRALFADALVEARREPAVLTLAFERGSLERIEALAQAERRCCAFLDFTVSDGPVLRIEAPAGAEEALDGFGALAEATLRP